MWFVFAGKTIQHYFSQEVLQGKQIGVISTCSLAQGLRSELRKPKHHNKCQRCSSYLQGLDKVNTLRKSYADA